MQKQSKSRLYYLIKLVAVSALIFSISVQASNNPPPTVIGFAGTNEGFMPELAGTVLVDEMIDFGFSDGADVYISGKVQQRVVRSSLDDSIDFYWRIINDPGSTESISFFHLLNFYVPGFSPEWRNDWPGDIKPVNAILYDEPSFDTNVDFEFGFSGIDPLAPGTESRFFFLNTTATEFAKTASFTLANIDHSAESNVFSTYEPRAVPLPAAVWLFAIGLGMLGRFGGFRL